MTGAYLRVERNGVWESVEVEHLTDKEREIALLGRGDINLLPWLNLVCLSLKKAEQYIKKEK